MGQRSTFTGFLETTRKLFDADENRELRHIIAVKLPEYPAADYMHLDVVINYPDAGKALVMPYFFDTDHLPDAPCSLLMKTLEALRRQSELQDRPMDAMVHPSNFKDAGSCHIYERGDGKPKLAGRYRSLIDYLVDEGKLEPDGIIYVGGRPEKQNDVEHLMLALMEQARGATNVVALKPGLVVSYERNHVTNESLRNASVEVKEWDDSYLDLLGGPHCSTSPLHRDPV